MRRFDQGLLALDAEPRRVVSRRSLLTGVAGAREEGCEQGSERYFSTDELGRSHLAATSYPVFPRSFSFIQYRYGWSAPCGGVFMNLSILSLLSAAMMASMA